jgi:glutamate synthase (NADPH) small chain
MRLEWKKDDRANWKMQEVPGSEFELPADLVLLAMGFVHPVHGRACSRSWAWRSTRAATSRPTEGRTLPDLAAKVFAAGDMRRGQSLVVWAIREGRQCARAVDEFLMGSSELPR